jgi:chitodextrinase
VHVHLHRRLGRRIRTLVAALAAAAVLAVLAPLATASPAGYALTGGGTPTPASAAACAAGWSSGAVYTQGNVVSHNGHNWQAKWWTQGEEPGTTGQWGVWADQGACDGGGDPGPGPGEFVTEAQFNQMFPNRFRHALLPFLNSVRE